MALLIRLLLQFNRFPRRLSFEWRLNFHINAIYILIWELLGIRELERGNWWWDLIELI